MFVSLLGLVSANCAQVELIQADNLTNTSNRGNSEPFKMTPEFKKNLEFRIVLMKDFYEHSKRSMVLVLTLIAGVSFFVIIPSIAVGEPREIAAAVVEYGNPGTGGDEYLVVKTEEGRELVVKMLGQPKIGDEITLEVRDRLFLYGPTYKLKK